jgi:hypothetical protein
VYRFKVVLSLFVHASCCSAAVGLVGEQSLLSVSLSFSATTVLSVFLLVSDTV